MTAAADIGGAQLTDRVVLLIDLSSLFWSAWHSSGEDEISQARRRTIEGVQRCIGDNAHRLVAICCDSGRSFRKDLYAEYKANRPEKDHASLGELDRVKEKLREDGFLLWEASGFEADDLIATACEEAVKRGHNVVIASADKDLLQLARPGVKALRTHNWTTVGEEDVLSRFGVAPRLVGDWLALVGDASDNIRGAPGVGPKTATDLLVKHGSLGGIFDALERDPASAAKPAVMRSLQQNAESVRLARQLVALRADAPIDFEDLYRERTPAMSTDEGDDDMGQGEIDDGIPISRGPGAAQLPPPAEAAPPSNGNGHSNGSAPVSQPTDMTVMPATIVTPTRFELALEPTDIGLAFKLGKALYASRLYARFPNPEAIAAVIIRGREMGLGALASLDVFHVVEGRPYAYAYLIIARAKADDDCEYFQLVDSSAKSATWETKNKRNPKPTKLTYTIEQAKLAGLLAKEKGNWNTRPDDMLTKTAGSKLARIEYPAAALGLISVEEAGLE